MSVSKAVRLRVSVGGELTVLQRKQRMFPLSVMRLSNDDAALRALVSHQCSGQIPTQCHTYVFSTYPEGCSPVFFPPEKTNFWKFQCEGRCSCDIDILGFRHFSAVSNSFTLGKRACI